MANVNVTQEQLLAKIGEQHMIITLLENQIQELKKQLEPLRQLESDVERGKVCSMNHG